MMRSPERRLLVISLVLACGLSATGCKKERTGIQLPAEPPAPKRVSRPGGDDTAKPADPADKSKPKMKVLKFSGATEAHRTSTLTPRVTGPIEKVHVREGDRVAAGTTLVTLDMTDMELRRRQAKAAVATAHAQANAVRVEVRRARRLVKDKAIAKNKLDQAEAQQKVVNTGIGQARAAVAMADEALKHGIITAPYESVVVKRHVSEGEYAAAMPPTPMVTLQELRIIDVRIQVPSADMKHIKEGDGVSIHFPAIDKTLSSTCDCHPDRACAGPCIKRIIPGLNPMTRSLSAVIELDNADYELMPGMYVDVTIERPLEAAK